MARNEFVAEGGSDEAIEGNTPQKTLCILAKEGYYASGTVVFTPSAIAGRRLGTAPAAPPPFPGQLIRGRRAASS
jgi:hypothetical protein